jgi:outer membrane protein OmpA-like peptidoglycan-associated protein
MSNMKRTNFFIIAICGFLGVLNASAQSDSLVVFTGTLVNGITGSPLPDLNVSYKKLPYESEIGELKTNSEGKFTAYFRATEKYSLLIENEGFIKIADIIDPLDGATTDLVLEKTFHLNVGGVGSVMKLQNLKFRQGEATILGESYAELDNLANMLKEAPNLKIRLEGHTDYVGNPTANLNLSQLRVDAVKKYLIEKGVEDSRIATKAFGGSQPVVRSNLSSERAVNRRVEVRIISEGGE